jgi:two-component system, chemotaxis family, chemotaxis protein CheY
MRNSRANMSGSFFPLDLSAISFLIVDDQPFSRRIVRSILHGFGSREVYESANGVEAIELAGTAMPHIIITDLIMPATSGIRLIGMLKALESSARRIPIIVLSGYLTKTAALAITNAGADELLVKPVSPKALYERIARIVLLHKQVNAPTSFLQNQRRHTQAQLKKAKEPEKDPSEQMAFVE